MEIFICINTSQVSFDESCSVKIDLPIVPRIGDTIFLKTKDREEITSKIAAKFLKRASGDSSIDFEYYDCFYGESNQAKKFEDLHINELSIEDYLWVDSVCIDDSDSNDEVKIIVGLTDNIIEFHKS